jgi:hypothetical protein
VETVVIMDQETVKLKMKNLTGTESNRERRKRGGQSTSDEEERLNRKPHFIYSNE